MFDMKWLDKIFAKPIPKPKSLTNVESFDKGILPCCGGTEYYEGPHGGINIKLPYRQMLQA